ncbi:hypothetical protein BC834DRAFT_614415 [Gloeopeniophorella convolvens]|nr:hypothetical protein BC834DRAFT_614415 [Gloeopeniophorella convolvens]
MTVLFKNLRIIGYVSVLLLAGGVLGISSYLASQFLPDIRFAFTTYSLVAPSFTIAVLLILLYRSRPWIDALFLFITAVSWLAWASDVNGPAECFALGNSRTHTVHGTISSKSFCYEAKILEGFSWAVFVLLTFFLLFVIALANRSQVLGWPRIWREDIINLPWFGQYPGYPGFQIEIPASSGPYDQAEPLYPTTAYIPPTEANGNIIQHQPGYSIIIWPGVNGEPPRIEQRPGYVTHKWNRHHRAQVACRPRVRPVGPLWIKAALPAPTGLHPLAPITETLCSRPCYDFVYRQSPPISWSWAHRYLHRDSPHVDSPRQYARVHTRTNIGRDSGNRIADGLHRRAPPPGRPGSLTGPGRDGSDSRHRPILVRVPRCRPCGAAAPGLRRRH